MGAASVSSAPTWASESDADDRRHPDLIGSSSARQTHRLSCLTLGADDALVMPAGLDECQQLVERVLHYPCAATPSLPDDQVEPYGEAISGGA